MELAAPRRRQRRQHVVGAGHGVPRSRWVTCFALTDKTTDRPAQVDLYDHMTGSRSLRPHEMAAKAGECWSVYYTTLYNKKKKLGIDVVITSLVRKTGHF